MNLLDMIKAVDLLYLEWDLGKSESNIKNKICAWIYLMEILEESESILLKKDGKKLIGFSGYSKWNSNKNMFIKKSCSLVKKILLGSLSIENRKILLNYEKNYSYLPKELENYFDGEVSILIIDNSFRGKGIGKKLLLETFELAKKDNMKNIQILSDESCNYKFYESCGCKKIYEEKILNKEPNRVKNAEYSTGYIYEKVLM